MAMLLVLVVVLVAVAYAARARVPRGAPDGWLRSRADREDALHAALQRAADTGIITPEQAEAVLASERALQPPEVRPPQRISPVLEALGYFGGILVMAGVVTLMSQFWAELATWSRLALLGAVAVGLTVAGLLITDEDEPVRWRLRGFLLLLGTAALAGFTGVLFVDGLDRSAAPSAFAVGVAVTAHAGVLWGRRDRPAQHAACFGGVIATTVGGLAWLGSALGWTDAGPGPIGVAVWIVAALWLAASLRDLLPPDIVGVVLGSVTTLVAVAPMGASWDTAAPLVGLTTAAALVAVGVRLDEFLATVVGVLGTLVFLPITVNVFFAGTIGVPAVMVISGLAVLGLAVWLFQRHSGPGDGFAGRRPRSAGHA